MLSARQRDHQITTADGRILAVRDLGDQGAPPVISTTDSWPARVIT
jgi:hypothetical protein